MYPKFVGPFRITQQVNEVAYKLDLPATMKIHDVFHVSLLKPYRPGRSSPPPCPIEIDGELEYEVETICTHRERTKGKKEYYVKWLGYGPEHCTWEPEAHLKNAPDVVRDYWQDSKVKSDAAARRELTRSKRSADQSNPNRQAPKRARQS